MAIIQVGLKSAEKSSGNDPTGVKTFLVGSDTKIADDINPILDASGVPAYNELWSVSETLSLRVDRKRAQPYDVAEGTQEGFWWIVTVNYAVPPTTSNQNEEDPRDRAWLWSKTAEKEERTLVASTFDTAGYIYPGFVAGDMVNLEDGKAVTNTAGEPPENGVTTPFTRRVITLSKYVDDPTDIATGASWDDLDGYIDTVNDNPVTLLDIQYEKWELYMDSIDYEPVNENGYDVIKVVIRIIADTFKKHVFSFPSAGYNEIKGGKLNRITNPKTGEEVASPKLLDKDGLRIPPPGSSPYVLDPILVSCGRHEELDWSSLQIPSSIP